jgi:hypothetical protein
MAQKPLRPTWRQLFSKRILCANALNVESHLMERAARLGWLAPQERIAETENLKRDAESCGNPLVSAFIPPLLKVFERDRVAVLGRTMLRVSVAIALYRLDRGRDPARLEDLVPQYLSKIPDCPLTGTPLRYRAARLWSIGINGVDDGGVDGKLGASDDGGSDGDVVWTVRPK